LKDGHYAVSEIFHSIQGEGRHTGAAMVFVRLAGCNYSCPWCDTDYSTRRVMTGKEIADEVRGMFLSKSYAYRRICITGGEPTAQDIIGLINDLYDAGPGLVPWVYVESNGSASHETYRAIMGMGGWVTISPKNKDGSPSSGWVGPCNEFKLVTNIWSGHNLDNFSSTTTGAELYLQPLLIDGDDAGNSSSREFVYGKCLENPAWRMSFQAHKFIGVR